MTGTGMQPTTKQQVYWRASSASEGRRTTVVLLDKHGRLTYVRRLWTDEESQSVIAVFHDDHLAWSRLATDDVQNVFGKTDLTLAEVRAELES